jgi:hypothetical protein
MKGNFPLWQNKKVENEAEHSMIEHDGAKRYWCEDEHSFKHISCGMYCMHKPGDGHIAWLAQKTKIKQQHATKKAAGSFTPAIPTSTPSQASTPKSSIGDSAKLTLLKSLQSALMTKAGCSEDQFKKIWDDSCSSLGN